MSKKKNKDIIINIIETDKCCFISDCHCVDGYDYRNHQSKIPKLFFDGEKAQSSFAKNWYIINNYPKKIERKEPDQKINKKYILKNPEMESKALQLKLEYQPCSNENLKKNYECDYCNNPICNFYELEYNVKEGNFIDANVKLNLIFKINNFNFPPKINYYSQKKNKGRTITNVDFKHQLLDKIIIPEVMLHEYPCQISSEDLYDIVRQHIKSNINQKHAKITKNYDFCFAVAKLIPLYIPQKDAYKKTLAKTQTQRQKIYDGVKEFQEYCIFSMTSEKEKYKGYPVIKSISAKSEKALKEKIDKYLNELIAFINEPLVECEHCKGRGYIYKEGLNSNE